VKVSAAGCKVPLGGRIYETDAASMHGDHLGSISS